MRELLTTLLLFGSCVGGLGYVPHLLYPTSAALINLTNYDSSVRPPGLDNADDPIRVSISLYLRSVEKIDQIRNEYKIQVTYREDWTDTRFSYKGTLYYLFLSFSLVCFIVTPSKLMTQQWDLHDRSSNVREDMGKSVAMNEVSFFWKPDVFFSNERTGHFHTLTKPNVFMRLRPNGHILISYRISLTLYCKMELWNFPFDSQLCGLRMASYGYTTDDVILQWKNSSSSVEVSKDIPVPGFTLQRTDVSDCHSKTSTGDYSCLLAEFSFRRDTYPYIIRLYIPLTILVLASWTSFWLPLAAATQRLTIGSITSVITALLIFREEEFLRLPSLTALDVWVGISALYVISAFFEFILITYLETTKRTAEVNDNTDVPEPRKGTKILWINIPEGVHAIDAVSKIAYPSTFALFHVVFGPMLF